MEGGGRGGKGVSIGGNDVVGQIWEDEKVEKFYALIKSYKEARDRRRVELERQSTEKRKRSMESGDGGASSWIPAFKLEDFAESSQIQFRNSPVSLPASFGSERDDPSPEGGGLDLRLRL